MAKVSKIIAIVLSSIISIGLIFTAYSGNLNPVEHPNLAVFGMSFPIFLIAQILVVILWLSFRKWIFALGYFAPIILCTKAVLIFCPLNVFGNSVPEDEKKSEFKLMTYNIYNFYDFLERNSDRNLTVDNILSVDADILCLQECRKTNEKLKITKEQHIAMKNRYPYSNYECFDIGILSKYPILSCKVLSNPGKFNAAKYEIDINGEIVNIISVHLQSIGLNNKAKMLYNDITSPGKTENKVDDVIGEVKTQLYDKLRSAMKERAAQAESLRKELDNTKGRVIICGDFNDTPNSYAYRTIRGDMNDAYVHCGFGPCITYNAYHLYFRIDHVFYDGKLEAVNVERPKFDASDHYPLVVDFVIKK